MKNLYKIHELVNSEGTILGLLNDDSDDLYILGRTDGGKRRILCKTNPFSLKLYLSSRISLIELFLLSGEHYIITGNKAEAKFFEITSDVIPSEIAGLTYGNSLFHLIPKSSRTEKTTSEILTMLPAVYDGVRIEELDALDLGPGDVRLFPDDSNFEIVQIESNHNPFEFNYLKAKKSRGNSSILCKITPMIMKLMVGGQISFSELFRCQSNSDYFLINENRAYKMQYSNVLDGHINAISMGAFTFWSIPDSYIIENPLEVWDYYTKNIVLSHFGNTILPADFSQEYPVEINIKSA